MTDKVLCPYCGAEMDAAGWGDARHAEKREESHENA